MTASHELIAHVRESAENSPYAVVEKPYGFDLTIDLADAKWLTLMRANGLKRVFTHEVRLKEASRTMVITDVENSVSWKAGPGTTGGLALSAQRSFKRGRVYQFSMQKELGVDARTGKVGTVVDYTFRAGEGRELVRRVAKEHGWSESMPAEQKGALIFGSVVGGLMVLSGLFLLVTKVILG